jgi:hypothetical protein
VNKDELLEFLKDISPAESIEAEAGTSTGKAGVRHSTIKSPLLYLVKT